MKKFLLMALTLVAGLTSVAQSGVNWDDYNFLGNGSGNEAYTNKIKVQKVDQIVDIINLQFPGFASEAGIYLTTKSGISSCSVSSDIQGAGIILHLSAFTAKETEVEITNPTDGTFSFWVYYEDGTESAGPAEPVAVTGVSLPATARVTLGKTLALTAEVTPAKAANKNVIWATDNAAVATVDANGVVTAVALGTANITATTEDGGFTATCAVTVVDSPVVEETEWTADDVNVAKGCAAYVVAQNGAAGPEYITNDVIDQACQLIVDTSTQREWMVVDLGYNYDVTKIQLITTGDRKDKRFAIYTAPAQAAEPAFANGVMAIDDALWTLAFEAEDEYTNKGVVFHAYSVNLSDVRYIKYEGVERAFTDQWGVGFVELRVAGTTNDDSATRPATIAVADQAQLFTGDIATLPYSVLNSGNGQIEFDPAQATATSANSAVATATIDGKNLVITAVAPGTTTVTLAYESLTATVAVEVLAGLQVAAPVPTHAADKVLALYSDAYDCTRNFRWLHWGWTEDGKEIEINGDHVFRAQNFKYYGSQFMDNTDVTGYTHMRLDVYPTAATTLGIVPITTKVGGGNNVEHGVTTAELTPNQWNTITISLVEFAANGVVDLDRLYQMKIVKTVNETGGQQNADGSFDVYFDNLYFYISNGGEPDPTPDPEPEPEPQPEPGDWNMTAEHWATAGGGYAPNANHFINWNDDKTLTFTIEFEEEHVGLVPQIKLMDNGDIFHSMVKEGNVWLYTTEPTEPASRSVANGIFEEGDQVNYTFYVAHSEGVSETHPMTYIVSKDVNTLISAVDTDSVAPVRYFNLQGVEVANPTTGLYIRVQGGNVTKVLVK